MKRREALSYQIATSDQAESDQLWSDRCDRGGSAWLIRHARIGWRPSRMAVVVVSRADYCVKATSGDWQESANSSLL